MIPAETYDNNGNTLSAGGKSFGYDSGNHLTSMNGDVMLVYDGDGNRVAKTAAGNTTTYLVDDLNPTGYPQVVEELVNGAPQRTYTYGRQRISQNQIVNGTWTASFYGYDGFASVRQLTDKTGAVTDAYEYDAWGNTINSTGTTPNNYLYRGEQYDSDLGLYYLRARYFNPATGRFLTRDSKAGNPRGPATLHRYLYADGDPVNGRDPSGHQDLIEYRHLEPEPLGAEAEVAGEEGAAGLGEGLGEGVGEGAGEGVGEGGEGAGGLGPAETLSDSAKVVRGGQCLPENFLNGSGVTVDQDGLLHGVSVQSSNGVEVDALSRGYIPNNQVGVTTVGDIRAAGGDVIPDPRAGNLYHGTLSGIAARGRSQSFSGGEAGGASHQLQRRVGERWRQLFPIHGCSMTGPSKAT
jgi:RHS repeat-associated protein